VVNIHGTAQRSAEQNNNMYEYVVVYSRYRTPLQLHRRAGHDEERIAVWEKSTTIRVSGNPIGFQLLVTSALKFERDLLLVVFFT
jgi:hypothetical protein